MGTTQVEMKKNWRTISLKYHPGKKMSQKRSHTLGMANLTLWSVKMCTNYVT